MFRKLRIAFSAACLVACGATIVFSLRSYRYWDSVSGTVGVRSLYIDSFRGRVIVERIGSTWPGDPPKPWKISCRNFDNISQSTINIFEMDRINSSFYGFRVLQSTLSDVTTIPYWALTLASAAFAAIPWTTSFQRRFSLRALLLATTFVAVILGMAVAVR
jgi:hypothetical protein